MAANDACSGSSVDASKKRPALQGSLNAVNEFFKGIGAKF